ncbi:MAG: hypothetical protein ABEJ07_00720 [Candidatus Nanohaloarchaea archaeon]
MEDISLKKAVKLGFGFGIGFAAASLLALVTGFLLYLPVMFGLG